MSEIELPDSDLVKKLMNDEAFRTFQKRLENNDYPYPPSQLIDSMEITSELSGGHIITRIEYQDTIFLERGSARYSLEQLISTISHETLHLTGLRRRILS